MQCDDFGRSELCSLLFIEQVQMDGGRSVGNIGNLHDYRTCNLIDHSACEESVLSLLSGHRFACHCKWQYV